MAAANDHQAHAPAGRVTEARRRKMKAFLGVVAAAAIALFLYYWLHARFYVSTDDAFIDGRIVSISPRVAGHVSRLLVNDNDMVTSGQLMVVLDPRDFQARVDLQQAALEAAEARAKAAEIQLSLTGVTSPAGEQQASWGLRQTESVVAAAEQAYAAALKAVAQAQADLDKNLAAAESSKAQVDASSAEAVKDKRDLERNIALRKSGTISQQEFDVIETRSRAANALLRAAERRYQQDQANARASEAALAAAREQAKAAQSQIGVARAQVGQAQGKLTAAATVEQALALNRAQLAQARAEAAQARAALEQARLDLSYTGIRAPRAGRITKRGIEAGAYVQVGQPLFALVADEMWVTANFKETQLAHMKAGQPVTIEIDAFPRLELRGRVDSIQSGTGARFSLLPPENATGNFVKIVQRVPVKIEFDNVSSPLKLGLAPGMSVIPEVRVR
ncbi:HlyD family secretion protein [bacterium]|nr:HlyD family secretion protein [bacterium]